MERPCCIHITESNFWDAMRDGASGPVNVTICLRTPCKSRACAAIVFDERQEERLAQLTEEKADEGVFTLSVEQISAARDSTYFNYIERVCCVHTDNNPDFLAALATRKSTKDLKVKLCLWANCKQGTKCRINLRAPQDSFIEEAMTWSSSCLVTLGPEQLNGARITTAPLTSGRPRPVEEKSPKPHEALSALSSATLMAMRDEILAILDSRVSQ